jgi:integrase
LIVRRFGIDTNQQVDRHEKPIWFPAQLLNILSADPTGLRALFDCVALTGTRLGEVLALKWKHVDLERRLLRIEDSLWRGQLLSPKTVASTRDIPLGGALSETLRNHRENSLHPGLDDFVFCKKDGSALDPDVLRKDALYPILDRLVRDSAKERRLRLSCIQAFRCEYC